MEQSSMTALVSAFSRAYHAENNDVKIFDDSIAKQLLTDEEYGQISKSMVNGISFFNPSFAGTEVDALRWTVDNQLSPPPLGRAAFAEAALEAAVLNGAGQYLILGAGYDTFAYRQPDWAQGIQIFEMDHPHTAADKQMRLAAAKIITPKNVHYISADFTEEGWQVTFTQNVAFSNQVISFCSVLGVAYYLSKQTFESLLSTLGLFLPKGSSIVFDYPDENSYTPRAGERAKKQAMLAEAANEKMLASYTYENIERMLSSSGFVISGHLAPMEMTAKYFVSYNHANPSNPIAAFDNVNYCLAVKNK